MAERRLPEHLPGASMLVSGSGLTVRQAPPA
jgi:hypothetical protein